MIKCSTPIMRKKFYRETREESFHEANKWLSKNSKKIFENGDLKDIIMGFEVDKSSTAVFIVFYTSLSEKDLRERHCMLCKQFHAQFFINQECNCSWCNTKSYQNRMSEMLAQKKKCNKDTLREVMLK